MLLGPEGYEEIESIVLMTPAELDKAIANGKVTDGFTLSALAMLKAKGLI